MFGSDNSIEPVRAVAAVAVTADGRAAARGFVEPMPIREATPADLAAAAARRANSSPSSGQPAAEPETVAKGGFFRRRVAEPAKPDAVAQQHGLYTADRLGKRHYYADYQQKREVMWAGAKSISSKLDDKQTVSAMLDLAQSRGWNTVRVKGTQDFMREAWVQAQVRGMVPEGYKPTATDQQEAARRTAALGPVKAGEAKAAENAGTPRDAARVTNTVIQAAPAETLRNAPAKAADAVEPKPAVAVKPVAAPAAPSVKAAKAAPVAAQAPPAAPAERLGNVPAKATAAVQAKAAVAATPAREPAAASAKAAPAASQAAQAAAPGNAAPDKAKPTPGQRSKAVWGAVEATGKQARAADAPAAKATAGERSSSAATA